MCRGTIRTFSATRRDTAWQSLMRVANGVAAARGITCTIKRDKGYVLLIIEAAFEQRFYYMSAGMHMCSTIHVK